MTATPLLLCDTVVVLKSVSVTENFRHQTCAQRVNNERSVARFFRGDEGKERWRGRDIASL
jgi:hypothetical protein